MLGLLSDSHGDLDAFDAAYELLCAKGAKRFVFLGGRYTDLDEWILRRKERARGGRSYSDKDFLEDIRQFLADHADDPSISGAVGEEGPVAAFDRIRERFLRTPERDCLHYLDNQIPKKVVEMVGDMLCCAVHDKNDLDREDLQNALIFAYGKESEPRVVQIGPRYFVSPGMLANAAEQTCGMIEPKDRSLVFSAYRLDGTALIDRHALCVERKAKLSVK